MAFSNDNDVSNEFIIPRIQTKNSVNISSPSHKHTNMLSDVIGISYDIIEQIMKYDYKIKHKLFSTK